MQQLKQKKIPVRRCVGCNAQRPKRELVRVVRSPEGEISIDLRGKAPGRGAYLCPSAACLAKARKAKRLERTFEVPIPDGIYDRLTEEIACAEQSAKEAASHMKDACDGIVACEQMPLTSADLAMLTPKPAAVFGVTDEHLAQLCAKYL